MAKEMKLSMKNVLIGKCDILPLMFSVFVWECSVYAFYQIGN